MNIGKYVSPFNNETDIILVTPSGESPIYGPFQSCKMCDGRGKVGYGGEECPRCSGSGRYMNEIVRILDHAFEARRKKMECKWYTVDYEGGCMECDITDEETSCCGDISRCECEQLRQNELKAEAIDFKADADRENSR